MPAISVIVPVYNVEPYINRCVDSILNQSFSDFELILIDDGSPDNCGKICDEYAKLDNRVYVIHQKNGGLSAARNIGIDWAFSNSNSEWITFVDSDDWVHKEYLKVLLDTANLNKVDVAVTIPKNVKKSETEESISASDFCVRIEYAKESYRNDIVHSWGKLYKKTLFKDIKFPVGRLHEDTFVTYQLLFNAEKYAVIDYPLYYYYINFNGITYSWNINRLDEFYAYEKQLAFFKSNGYKIVMERTLRYYFKRLYRVYDILESTLTGKELKVCKHRVRCSLRRVLIKYVPFRDRKKYIYYYELAFPISFRIINRIKQCFSAMWSFIITCFVIK